MKREDRNMKEEEEKKYSTGERLFQIVIPEAYSVKLQLWEIRAKNQGEAHQGLSEVVKAIAQGEERSQIGGWKHIATAERKFPVSASRPILEKLEHCKEVVPPQKKRRSTP